MSFDNAKFEKNAKETMSTLEKLKEKLNFEGAVKGFGKLEDSIDDLSFDELNGGIEKTSSKFSALEAVALGALMNIGSQIESTAQKLVSSLTIDQISAGWSKYEQKTSSVQTIMNSTGKSMEEVNEQLDKLNWYTDETSYNFLDMVSNIGKFTSNSVELGTAVTAMQGIANWAALSGANVTQAGNAMYNLAQAISVGSVKLIDWKSIENANMATTEFKQTVIDTAVELGTLKQTTSGYATVAKGTAVSVTDFNSALSEGWFSSDVLLKSLNEYGKFSEALYGAMDLVEVDTTSEMISLVEAYKEGSKSVEELSEEMGTSLADTKAIMDALSDSTMELSMKAFKAGQETKTLSEAIAYVKEAVSSGWMNTFEIIFGDYEEAKKLWSNLSETLYSVFVASGETRNELLKGALDNSAEFVTKDDWEGLTEGLDITEDLQNGIISFAKENGVAIDDLISQYGTFEKSLSDGWLTSDLFTNYVVELLNSTDEESEALQNFALNIDDTSSALSELVDKLNRKSGRTLLIESVQNAFDAACKVVGAFKDAVSDVFPAITSEGIYNAIEKVNEFTESLIASDETVEKFTNGFKGVLSVVRTIGQIATSLIKVAAKGTEVFQGISEVALSIFNLLGKIVTEMTDATAETGAFTSVGNTLYKIVSNLVTAFNKFASSLSNTIDQIANSSVISKFASASKKIGTAFTTVISTIGETLFNYSSEADDAVESTDNLTNSLENTSTVGSTIIKVLNNLLDGISTVFNKVKNSQAITNITTAFENLKATLAPLVSSIVNLFKTVGTSLISVLSEITGQTDITDIISNILETAINGIATLIGWITALVSTVNQSGIFETIGNGITYIFQSIRDGISGSAENSNFISNIFSQLSKFSDFLAESANNLKGLNLFDALKTALESAITAFSNFDNSVSNTLMPAIESIRDLLGGDEALFNIIGLAEIYYLVKAITSLVNSFKTLSGVTEALSGMMKSFGTAAKGFAQAAKWEALGTLIKDFAIAIALLAASMVALSVAFKDPKMLAQCTATIAVLGVVLAGVMTAFSKLKATTKDLPAVATILSYAAAVMALGIAFDMVAAPILIFCLLPWENLKKAAAAAGVAAGMLVVLATSARLIGKQTKGAAVILALAAALNLLIVPIVILSKIDLDIMDVLTIGIVALSVALATSSPLVATNIKTLATSLLYFAASIAAIGIAVPVSVLLFINAVKKLKELGDIGDNIGAIVAAIVIGLGSVLGAVMLFSAISPYIAPGIAALKKLSTSIGTLVLSVAGLAVVAVMIEAFSTDIALAMTNLIDTLCGVIINTSDNVAKAFIAVITALLVNLANQADTIVEALWTIIEAILKAVAGRLTAWEVEWADKHGLGWLISDGAREDAEKYGYEVAQSTLDGYEKAVEERDDLFDLTKVTSLSDYFDRISNYKSNEQLWTEATGQEYSGSGLFGSLTTEAQNFNKTALGVVSDFIKKVGEYWERGVAQFSIAAAEDLKQKENAGSDVANGLADGFVDSIEGEAGQKMTDASSEAGDEAIEALKESTGVHSPSTETYKIGVYFCQGFVNGVNDGTKSVTDSAETLGSVVLSTLADKLGIHSPSDETYLYGDYIDQGLANGIDDNSDKAATSAENLATSVTNSLDEAGAKTGESTGDAVAESMSNELDDNSQDITDAGLTVINDLEVPLASASEAMGVSVVDSTTDAIVSRINENGSKITAAWSDSLTLQSSTTSKLTKASAHNNSLYTGTVKTSSSSESKGLLETLSETVENTLSNLDASNVVSDATKSWLDSINTISDSVTSAVSSATSSSTSSSTTKNAIVKLGYVNGEYYVEGLTSGITDSMNSEEIIEKKASNIQTAFNKEIDKLDLSETASDLDYELWANLYEETADAQELYAKKTAKISKKIDAQTKKMNFYQAEYNMMIKQFGEESKQAQQAYNDMIQAQIDLNSLNDELKQTNLIVYDKLTEGYENDLTTLSSKSKTLDAEEEYLEAIYGNTAIAESKKFTESEYYAKKYINALQQVNVLQKEYNNYASEEYKSAFLEAGGTELEYAQLLEESYQNLLSAKTDFVNDWNDIGDTLEWPKWFVALGSNISSVIADNTDNTVAISKISGTLEKVSGKITGVLGKYIGEDTVTSITNGIKQFIDEDGADVLTDATTAIWSFYKGDVAAGITGTFQFVGDLSGTTVGQTLLSALKTKLEGSGGILELLKSIFSNLISDGGLLSTLWNIGVSLGSKLLGGIKSLFSGSQNGGIISTITSWGSNLLSSASGSGGMLSTLTSGLTSIGTKLTTTFSGSSGIVSTIANGLGTIGTKVAGLASTAGVSLGGIATTAASVLGPVGIGVAAVGLGAAMDKYVTGPIRDSLSEAADTAEEKGQTIKSGILNIGSSLVQLSNPISFVKGLFTGDSWTAVSDSWKGLGQVVTGVASKMKTAASSLLSSAKSAASSAVSTLKSAVSSAVETGSNIVSGVANGVKNTASTVVSTVKNVASKAVNAFKSFLGIHSPSTVMADLAEYMDLGIAEGLTSNVSSVISAVKSVATKITSTMSNSESGATEAGSNIVSGITSGISSAIGSATSAIKSVATTIMDSFKNVLGIHSPSTVMAGLAEFVNEGLANGLNSTASLVSNAASGVGGGVYNAVATALDATAALADDSLDYEPAITPVVDLGNLQSSVGSALATAADLNLNKAFDDQLYQLGDVTINNNDVVDAIDELSSKFDTLREAITNMKLVTDTGALVGQIIDSVDGSLGQLVGYAERGI
jgi:phage-related protein